MALHRSMLPRPLKLPVRPHSNARRTGSSSLVHTFRRSSSSSLATPTIARVHSLFWPSAAPGAESFVSNLDASGETGNISLVVLGDADHASFDNITFADDRDTILVTEDRGDTLHDQLNTLDSIWAYKLNKQRPNQNIVSRFVALGLDRLGGLPGEEDKAHTGLAIS